MLIIPDINSIFIKKDDNLNDIESISDMYNCILYQSNKPLTSDSKDSLIEFEGYKLFYVGNPKLIIKIIYFFFEKEYNKNPFDNMDFLSLILEKNKVQYIKGDGIAFLEN